MYVSGIASATRAGRSRTSSTQARSLPFVSVRAVTRGEQLDDLGADVVTRARVLVAGIAEPDHQEVGGGAAARHAATRTTPRRRSESSAGVAAVGGRAALALFALALFALALFALVHATRGIATCATSSSASCWSGDPGRQRRGRSTWSWSPIASPDTSISIDVGMLPGIASTVRCEDQLLEQAAVADARRPRRRGAAGPRRSPRRRGRRGRSRRARGRPGWGGAGSGGRA